MSTPQRAPWWAIAATVLGGSLAAIQSRVNSDLAAALYDPYAAALISFGIGLCVLTGIILSRPHLRALLPRYFSSIASGALPWYYTLGGIAGAFLVLTQGLVVGSTGVAMFIISIVAGQTLSGLVLDRVGFGPGGPRALDRSRLAGAILMVLAVAVALSGGITAHAPFLLLLPLLAGIGIGYQVGANGIVTHHSGHYLISAFGNFAMGTFMLAIIAGISIVTHGMPSALPTQPHLYTGGLLGLTYIAAAAALVRYTGVLVLAMSAIAGQIIGSIVIDALTAHGTLSPLSVAGAALTLVAALISTGFVPGRKRRHSTTD